MRFISFSYKRGQREHPSVQQADAVLDVRNLPNPWKDFRDDETGRSPLVQQWLWRKPAFRKRIVHSTYAVAVAVLLIDDPNKEATIAIGCVGGTHRSVAVAEILADALGGTTEHLALND